MVHEALEQWRKKNCAGLTSDPALSRFLSHNLRSREPTPNSDSNLNHSNRMTLDSPFFGTMLSPLSPLVALGSLIEDTESMAAAVTNCDQDLGRTLSELSGNSEQELGIDLDLAVLDEDEHEEILAGSASSDVDKAEKTVVADPPLRPTRQSCRKIKRSARTPVAPKAQKKAAKGRARAATVPSAPKKAIDAVFVEQPLGESRKCSCKKSKCLKLYCECFAAGVLCDPSCKCTDCHNTSDHVEERRKAVAYKLARKPKAFQHKIVETAVAKDGAVHTRGCNCKRSGCQKKYCECYQGGIACSEACKCVGCKNDGGLMHLRDLGVAGWKAPEGGFKNSAIGLISMMSFTPRDEQAEEPIPTCETEMALQKHLLEEHSKREAPNAPGPVFEIAFETDSPYNCSPVSMIDEEDVKGDPIWPVARPAQHTPRSGTFLEPYPTNQKRRCQQKTPKSFGMSRVVEMEEADGMLVGLEDLQVAFDSDDNIEAHNNLDPPDSCDKLPKGIKYRAQWSSGHAPGYYRTANGKLCWGIQDSVPGSVHNDISKKTEVEIDLNDIDTAFDEADVELLHNINPATQGHAEALDGVKVKEEDRLMAEMEISMADLLTPRTPHLTKTNLIEADWDMMISTPHSDCLGAPWDLSTPRSTRSTGG